jgi:hypothetical protein
VSKLGETFRLISDCLKDGSFGKHFYPWLLVALAQVISACPTYVSSSDRDQLWQIYDDIWRGLPKEFKTPDDIEYANSVFWAVFAGFAALLKTYDIEYVNRDKALMKKILVYPPPAFAGIGHFKNGGQISVHALMAFLDLLVAYNDVFGKHGNIILNRRKNYALMAYAQAVDNNPGLSDKATRVMKIVKQA